MIITSHRTIIPTSKYYWCRTICD